MNIFFDVKHLYYLPQYLPVFDELSARGHQCVFIIHRDQEYDAVFNKIITGLKLKVHWADGDDQALAIYQQESPDWIIFGNTYSRLNDIHNNSRSALLYHGIGIKDCYYDKPLLDMDIRFIEGAHREREILHRFPKARVATTGFAKLDPLFNNSLQQAELLKQYGLDPRKKTILYAPTFYPSSIELLDKNWPQEFGEYNIIIKPHFFSLTRAKYHKQQKLFAHWDQYSNTYIATLEDFNLLPFMAAADLLISEASSALFEFAAMNKPVVWCDFIKLRWSYRGPLRYRYTKRMDQTITQYEDIASHARKYSELKLIVDREIHSPERLKEKRHQYTEELIGKTDGKASARIVDILENKKAG